MPQLGRIITRLEAENEIRTFLQIRQNTYNAVIGAVSSIPGPLPDAVQFFSSEKISFVFEKAQLEQLLMLGGSSCNGVRVYLGAAPASCSEPSVEKRLTNPFNGTLQDQPGTKFQDRKYCH